MMDTDVACGGSVDVLPPQCWGGYFMMKTGAGKSCYRCHVHRYTASRTWLASSSVLFAHS